jgi:1-deoxy-D-xylulose-5-phosphate reductoisomerase
MKTLSLFGATGSIGDSTLKLVDEHPDQFSVSVMSAHRNYEKLAQLAKEYEPDLVVIADSQYERALETCLLGTSIRVTSGTDALCEAARIPVDCVVAGIVGFAGLMPVRAAIQAGQTIALANKETLVAAGHLIMPLAATSGASLLPVDSEHNAIAQCLVGARDEDINKVVLTASGGPFRALSRTQMHHATKEEALLHPNWSMGQKITIDSATMMNKGLELIEAAWLFGLGSDRLDALIHPQSIVHGMVSYCDGSWLVHMGPADMRVPLSHALGYPRRLKWQAEQLDLVQIARLDFQAVCHEQFPCFAIAKSVIGTDPADAVTLNAANEVAVSNFLSGKIPFGKIAEQVDTVMSQKRLGLANSFDDILSLDQEIRKIATFGI